MDEDVIEMDEILGIWQEVEGVDSIPPDIEVKIEDASGKTSASKFAQLSISELDSIFKPSSDRWHWMVEKGANGSYLASHYNYDAMNTFRVHCIELDGNKYLDLQAHDLMLNDYVYDELIIKTHLLLRVRFAEDFAFIECFYPERAEALLNTLDLYPPKPHADTTKPLPKPSMDVLIDQTPQLQESIRELIVQDSCWHLMWFLKKKK